MERGSREEGMGRRVERMKELSERGGKTDKAKGGKKE